MNEKKMIRGIWIGGGLRNASEAALLNKFADYGVDLTFIGHPRKDGKMPDDLDFVVANQENLDKNVRDAWRDKAFERNVPFIMGFGTFPRTLIELKKRSVVPQEPIRAIIDEVTVDGLRITESDMVTITKELISPQQAQQWLEKCNKTNRNLGGDKVNRLAEKMDAGKWVFTHEGFAFDLQGNLLDGQHRLAAIVKHGKPVEFVVTRGLDKAVFDHIDTEGGRNANDLLVIRAKKKGEQGRYTKWVVAASAMMLRGISNSTAKFEPAQVAEFGELRNDLIVPFVEQIKKAPASIMRTAPIIAAFVNAVRTEDGWPGAKGGYDNDTLMLLAMRWGAAEWTGERDPMKALFVRLMKENDTGKRLSPTSLYALTVAALRAAMANQPRQKLEESTVDWGDAEDRPNRKR